MSDSRLEKFIYAICSMDVSDLPVPLSRIEKLWNCLITGETPDFEPLSRNEKYLMAMLDRYDISNLPAPMSRGEKLLYKIAVGETDLSDVPGYLSRYEELLKYLIENGGIGFEYVLHTFNQSLYTLYTTAEKPVKSAILKGQTLVNLSENLQTITFTLSGWYRDVKLMNNIEKLKRNTYYTVLYRLENISGNHQNYNGISLGIGMNAFNKDLPNTTMILDKNGGWCKIKFQLTDELIEQSPTYKHLYIRPIRRGTAPVEGESIDYTIKGFTILEGDYITNPIPFNEVFEGMQSVKMPVLTTTGKNLFDGKLVDGYINSTTGQVVSGSSTRKVTDYIEIKNNTQYISSGFTYTSCWEYDKNKQSINQRPTNPFISSDNAKYVRFTINSELEYTQIQIEESSVATSYEPYKSNILSTPEDLELRGIGNVKDELDVATGELTQRIGEIVLDGSEDEKWMTNVNMVGVKRFLPNFTIGANTSTLKCICDKYPNSNTTTNNQTKNCFRVESNDKIYIIDTNYNDVESFKLHLQSNPIKIQYEMAKTTIKTVDLTTVDQDGQPTKLKTFNDITHVEIKADNLIPSVEVEVATKISETLSTMGPQQLDISETQNKLGQTINEQTENTDATMLATTEIYEQTL